MVLTFRCAGDLRNVPIAAWGARWEAARRKGESKGCDADKHRARTVGGARSISEAYTMFMGRTYMKVSVLVSLHGVRPSLGKVLELKPSATQRCFELHTTYL